MAISQPESNVFTVRIVSIDHSMAPPVPGLDICYSSFQGEKVNEVPVIRIYGPTPSGQKTCLHIHGVLPYLYVPYADLCPEGSTTYKEGDRHAHELAIALEKALKLKGNVGSKRQHVHDCRVVRAKRLYGYHKSEELFLKINLYHPHDVSRASTLLLNGGVLDKSLQPHESHIPFLLQFLIDYNLYGMGHIHLSRLKFRHPMPQAPSPRKYVCSQSREEMNDCTPEAAQFQEDPGEAAYSSPVWTSSPVPVDWTWHASNEMGESSNEGICTLKRQSICELEGDAAVEDILNQQLKTYTSLSQLCSDVKLVQSLVAIWQDEYERTGILEDNFLQNPGKLPPEDVLKTFSLGVGFESKLMELCSDVDESLCQCDTVVGHSFLPSVVMQNLPKIASGSPDIVSPEKMRDLQEKDALEFQTLNHSPQKQVDATSSEGRNASLDVLSSGNIVASDVTATDLEAQELLRWLATSQAAEDINSDDELIRETILTPVLPATSIDKVLEKASMDYESESQKECQDILDSVEDSLDLRCPEENAPPVSEDSNLLMRNMIPQSDGFSDGPFSSFNTESGTGSLQEDVKQDECEKSLQHLEPLDCNTCSSKNERNRHLWGTLSISVATKVTGKFDSGGCNRSYACLDDVKEPVGASSFVQNILEKLPDDFVSKETSNLIGCSVRDLMRRKRSRTEPAGCGSSRTKRLKLNKETEKNVAPCRKKLEFLESYKDKCERKPPEYIFDRPLFTNPHAGVHEGFAPNTSHLEGILDNLSTSNSNINLLETSVHSSIPQVWEKPQLTSETKIQDVAACMAKSELNDVKESESGPGPMGTVYSRGLLCDVEKFGVKDKSKIYDHLQQECASCSGSVSAFPIIYEMLGMEGDVKTCENECKMCISSGKSPQPVDKTDFQDNKNCVGEEQGKHLNSLDVGCSMSIVVDKEAKPVKVIDRIFCREASEPSENGSHFFSVKADSEGKPGRHSFGSLPYNDGSCQRETESENKYLEKSVHFSEEATAAVQRLYQRDGSCLYLLTPVISPPSVDSVKQWLVDDMEGTSKGISAISTEPQALKVASGCVTSAESPSSDASSEAMIEGETGSLMGYAFEQTADEKDFDVDLKSNHNVDKLASTPQNGGRIGETDKQDDSQDRSQISGPDVKSKPTPLSQIGFRDSASIGAGQQLTLLSVEVHAECRGDLRPDPRFDAVNIVALAFQNDNDSVIEVHVLLYSKTESSKRNPDGISGCKVFVFSEEKELFDFFTKFLCSLDPDILMGWDVQGGSLGYLAERSAHLGIRLLNNISRILPEGKRVRESKVTENEQEHDLLVGSLVAESAALGNAVIQDEWGRTHASGLHVDGRIVLNIWRLIRSEVKLNLYTVEAVAESVLMRKIPSIHHKVLRLWFSTGPSVARYRCIEYMVERAKLNLEIMNQLDMINRTSELARVFGIDFFSVLSRGSQYRVESMLLRLAHTQNYLAISPGNQQVASQPAMECLPLVMEPESGFFSDPVIVLDFQSLYPSMVIAYNLCFCTCLGKVSSNPNILGVSSYSLNANALRDLKEQILLTPNGAMYVSPKVRKGVLPRLLEEILSTRIMVKHAMKKLSPSQRVRHRILNARQLALKLIANVTYGYTAAGFSGRMPCAELADSIVQCGRSTLERAIAYVNANEKWRAKVVYGDTDSMFVLLKGRSLKEAFEIGNEIASAITAINPNPVTLKMEKVYQPCFLLTKKRYVGYSYESPDQVKPLFDAKGIETVRRDTCRAVVKTMEQSLRLFFEHQDISEVKSYLQRQWSRIMSGRVSLQDFVFAKEVRLGTYSTSSSILPPAAIVAAKAMRADPRAEPRYAERVPYVVIHGDPGARLIDMVVDPLQLLALDSPYRLNDLYYINKQIIPALQRIFGLVGADLKLWFMEMPRPMKRAYDKYGFNGPSPHKKRIDHYYLSRNCLLCGELVQASASLCTKCSQNEVAATAVITGRSAKLERDMQHLAAICRHCGGGDWLMESGVKCTSLACSVFYERRKVQKEFRGLSAVAYEKGLYPKCSVEWF